MSFGAVTILDTAETSSGGPKHVRFTVVGDGAYPAGGTVGLSALLAAAAGDNRELFEARGSGPNGDVTLEYTPLGAAKVVTVALTDLFTTADGSAHGLSSGDAVYFYMRETANSSSPPVAPGGLTTALPNAPTAATPYYVIASGLTTTAFKVSATVGGSAVDITALPNGKLLFRKADKLLVRVMDTGVESATANQSGTTYTLAGICR